MKSDAKKVFEIVGILSVVASLIFVGMQLMFDRQLATAEQYQNRAESRKSDFRTMLESDAYMTFRTELWEGGERPAWWTEEMEDSAEQLGLSATSIVVSLILQNNSLVHFDNLYFQYDQGLLDEAFWQSSLGVVESMLNNPQTRAVWVNEGLRRPIMDLVDNLILESN